jgi:peptide/nickel transport system permease protein
VSVVLVVTFMTALLLRIVPGDPARTMLGSRANPTTLRELRHEFGTDQSVPAQLGASVGRLAQGDLGTSLTQSGRPVTDIVRDRTGVTLELLAVALVFGVLFGVALGLLSGLSTRLAVLATVRGTMLLGLALPIFVIGLVLLFVVGVELQLAPAGGWGNGGLDNLQYLWLPALALSIYLIAMVARTTSRAAQTVKESQFYEAAVARGLTKRRLILRHVLPNSLVPVIVLVGVNAAALVTGTVTVEAVFGLPGLGTELLRAAQTRDFPVVQGIAVVSAIIVVMINWMTDLVVAAVDPRVRRAL